MTAATGVQFVHGLIFDSFIIICNNIIPVLTSAEPSWKRALQYCFDANE